ncbi:ATP-binding protein [Agromyces fucosus]|uniref:ATP-binding protein n=1 Tax=Agromyces fucosus TaxID=41985 RepID=A0A4Q2JPM8_9MICO|nr:ATP-binding protein [Agromyces fucosus]RXZ48649.1 ATP-binding protein [Agromyces fucosus]
MREATSIGHVRDIDGASVAVALAADVPTGLVFVAGEPYSVGQVGSFVRIPAGLRNLVGVVTRVGAGAVPESVGIDTTRWMSVQLVGETQPGSQFQRGVAQLPSIGDRVHLVTRADLSKIYGHQSAKDGYVRIGQVASAESIDARVDLNRLVSRHSAVLGSTGSGKSTTVATFLSAMSEPNSYPSARVLLFDLHGEYARAFAGKANVLTLDRDVPGSELLHIPYWALTFDELIPLLFGALPDDAGRAYVRDEITRLKRSTIEHGEYNLSTEHVTVDSPVPFSVHQLWFDIHVLLNATHTVPGGQSRDTWALARDANDEDIQAGDPQSVIAPVFSPQTQAAGQNKIYLSSSPLNIRRQVDVLASRLRDRRFEFLLRPGNWAPDLDGSTEKGLADLLEIWLGPSEPITIIDLSGAPPAIVGDLVGSMTRVAYDAMYWARNLSEGARERPLLFVFEEAHAYLGAVGSGSARTAVQRIVREGRKYGVGAMIVSQRPSELDSTILSQCGTLIALRLTNSADRAFVLSSASDNMAGILSMLPILRTGEAIIVGESVPLPTRTLVALPEHKPDSADPVIAGSRLPGGWDREREPSRYSDVALAWETQNARLVDVST